MTNEKNYATPKFQYLKYFKRTVFIIRFKLLYSIDYRNMFLNMFGRNDIND